MNTTNSTNTNLVTETSSAALTNNINQADITQTTSVFISASVISVLLINAILFLFLKFVTKNRN